MTEALASLINQYFDPRDLLAYLLLFMGFDILTGLFASARERRIASSVAWKGIARKAGTVSAVFFLMALEPLVKEQLNRDLGIAWLVTMGFVGVEVLSVIENLSRSGVTLPNVVRDTFAQIASTVTPPPRKAAKRRKPKAETPPS